MNQNYKEMINAGHSLISETRHPYCPFSERHLQVIWLEQKFLNPLFTHHGKPIEIISPGKWNMEAGPDFRDAHLRIGGCDYRGDVEIHLDEQGWYHHGHHCDQRYNRVILHVSYYPAVQLKLINKENGQQAFACHLEKNLKISSTEIASAIDLDLYPQKIFAVKGHCAEKVFQILPETELKQFFQSAAYWRLEKKLNFLQRIFSQSNLQFASGVALALGYKNNSKSFLELFCYLLNYRDLPYEELLAIALGICGFLEEGRKKSWEESSFYQKLQRLWWGKKDQIEHQAILKLDRIRPFHHPVRRLAYLAHFLQDARLENFWLLTLQVWTKAMLSPSITLKELEMDLLDILPDYKDDYWDYHYTFENQIQKKKLPRLGNDIRMHLLLNTTLPLLYGEMKKSSNQQPQMWEKFQRFYLSLKTPATSKSLYLHQRFFGDQLNKPFFNRAQMAQGAYQLHQDFCLHYEASCEGCPFIDRFHSIKIKN